MRSLLQDRESEYETKVQGRFSRLQDKLGKRRNDQVDTIKHNLKRNLRKLDKQHREKQEPRKSGIIERLTVPKSDLYAPQMRLGEHLERRHETLQKRFLSETYIDREYISIIGTLIFQLLFQLFNLSQLLLRRRRYDAQLVADHRGTESDQTKVQTYRHLYTRDEMDGGKTETAPFRSEGHSDARKIRRRDSEINEA